MNLTANTDIPQMAGWIGMPEIILLVVVAGGIILPLLALIDIMRSDFESNDKLIWIIVVLLLPLLGSILYFIIGVNKKKKLY